MNANKITINNNEYTIKYTIRALFIFEQITGKSFKLESLLDNYVFFYSIILANNQDMSLTWDDFIAAIDSDPNLIKQLNDLLNNQDKLESLFDSEEDKATGEKKN